MKMPKWLYLLRITTIHFPNTFSFCGLHEIDAILFDFEYTEFVCETNTHRKREKENEDESFPSFRFYHTFEMQDEEKMSYTEKTQIDML